MLIFRGRLKSQVSFCLRCGDWTRSWLRRISVASPVHDAGLPQPRRARGTRARYRSNDSRSRSSGTTVSSTMVMTTLPSPWSSQVLTGAHKSSPYDQSLTFAIISCLAQTSYRESMRRRDQRCLESTSGLKHRLARSFAGIGGSGLVWRPFSVQWCSSCLARRNIRLCVPRQGWPARAALIGRRCCFEFHQLQFRRECGPCGLSKSLLWPFCKRYGLCCTVRCWYLSVGCAVGFVGTQRCDRFNCHRSLFLHPSDVGSTVGTVRFAGRAGWANTSRYAHAGRVPWQNPIRAMRRSHGKPNPPTRRQYTVASFQKGLRNSRHSKNLCSQTLESCMSSSD